MDKKLVGLISVFLLVFGVFMSFLVFGKGTEPLGIRASGSTKSCPNSFLFANQVSSNGQAVTILASVRNTDSVGLANVAVTCATTLGTLTPTNGSVTNSSGNISFSLESNAPGIATVSCSVAPCGQIGRIVTVEFAQ